MFNQITVVGRLIKDPESKTTPNGKILCNCCLAVSRQMKDKDGNYSSDFFNVTLWGQQAEYAGQYIGKGRLVIVSGRMESQQVVKDSGNVTYWTIQANTIKALEKGVASGSQGASETKDEEKVYDPFDD